MSDRRKLIQELWTVPRLLAALPKIIEHLGHSAHGVWFADSPGEFVRKLELTDRLEVAEASVILATLHDLAMLEISRPPEGHRLGFWVRTGTLAAYMNGRPQSEVESMLATFLGYAEEPRCRSG